MAVNKLNCVLLIDDNADDNFIHERLIKKHELSDNVIATESAEDAIDYLTFKSFEDYFPPDLILLDINMPGTDGWGFLKKYETLEEDLQGAVVVILTSLPAESLKDQAAQYRLNSIFKTKPLTKEMMEEIINTYFQDN